MSTLSRLWQKQRRRWYRRGISRAHALRRYLAYEVARLGFEIGDYSYGAPIIRSWGDGSRLIVGRYCSIAPDAEFILGGNHRLDLVTTYPMDNLFSARGERPLSRGDIVIGSDVWIATGATIMSGVTIGDGAAIGAHAVVTHDVEPYAVVAGNPARLIRRRFSDDVVRRLLQLRWWELSVDQIRPLLPLLQSQHVEEFIEHCGRQRPAADAALEPIPSPGVAPALPVARATTHS